MSEAVQPHGSAWLCQIQQPAKEDHSTDIPMLLHAAVWAETAEEAKKVFMRSVPDTANTMTKVLRVTDASDAIDVKQQALAKRVNPFVKIALGQQEPLTEACLEHYDNTEYLTISEHDIPPLLEQKGVPFWDKEWIVPELQALLFDQPDPQQRLNTFFVVDATLRRKVTQFFDLNMLDIPLMCLFKGKAAKKLEEAAPYLMDISLTDNVINHLDKIPSFHRDFFRKHWDQGTGIAIRTTASMEELHHHLRKFTQYQNKQGKVYFFRFWETNCTYDYFTHIQRRSGRAKGFFHLHGKHWITMLVSHNERMQRTYTVTPDINTLHTKKSEGVFSLTKKDEAVLMDSIIRSHAFDIQQLIVEDHAEALSHIPDNEIEAMVFQQVKKGHEQKTYNIERLTELAEDYLLETLD